MTTECTTVRSTCPVCPPGARAAPHAQGPDFEYETTGDTEWSLQRCEGCGTIFLDPRPEESELGRIYPPTYYAYDFTVKQSLGFRVKTHLDARAARHYLSYCPEGTNILDIGCGDGRLLRVLAEQGIPRQRLYGCDFDEAAIQRGQEQGLQVSLGRFEDADLPPGSFGLVVLQQVIEHVPDPASVLEKIQELLVPGGAVILETPNVRSWDHALFNRRYWGGYHIPRHFFLFTDDSLGALLRRQGYEVEETTSLLSPSFWVQSVHHSLKERPLLSPLRKLFHPQRPNAVTLAAFSGLDVVGKQLGVTSNMRVVGRKPRVGPRDDSATPVSRETFQVQGYDKADGLFSAERVAACRERFDELWQSERASMSIRAAGEGDGFVKVHQLATREPVFRDLAEDPALRAAVEALIGPARVFRDVCVGKPAGSVHDLGLHQDAAYWDVAPERLVSAWIALDDVPPEKGCLRVVPGSHHQVVPHDLWFAGVRLPRVVTNALRRAVSFTGTGDNPTTPVERAFFRAKQLALGPLARVLPGAEQLNDLALDPKLLPAHAELVEVPAKPGDVILFHGLLLHGSGPNTTREGWRRAYIVTFAGG